MSKTEEMTKKLFEYVTGHDYTQTVQLDDEDCEHIYEQLERIVISLGVEAIQRITKKE